MSNCRTVYFVGPRTTELREQVLNAPAPGELLVKTSVSAISSGTEMLFYRGQIPDGLAMDASISALKGAFHYPLVYGYAAVGRVVELGEGVAPDWLGRQVFSFQPHTSHFLATPETVMALPEGVPAEAACFLPNMETAVNLVQDGAPILGENCLIFGQGIVGLLTVALLRQFPLHSLATADLYPFRRNASLALGVTASLDPTAPDFNAQLRNLFPGGADLTFELSGAPATLDQAIAATIFSGRVVIGSWYGSKPVTLNLGGSFHRSRIRLISSQVSSIAPDLTGRWDKSRRFETAWQALRRIQPEKWITHRFAQDKAADAYTLLDNFPFEALQIILEY
jgi:2-desacetyl-2-hydroxyethyl bacteriochlorophyllide A dehydrogenase